MIKDEFQGCHLFTSDREPIICSCRVWYWKDLALPAEGPLSVEQKGSPQKLEQHLHSRTLQVRSREYECVSVCVCVEEKKKFHTKKKHFYIRGGLKASFHLLTSRLSVNVGVVK